MTPQLAESGGAIRTDIILAFYAEGTGFYTRFK
jgi:hypothetical protein